MGQEVADIYEPVQRPIVVFGSRDRAVGASAERRAPDLGVLASIGIALVVLGHSFPDLAAEATGVGAARQLKAIIYVFHMPLFFYMSGYLLQNWIEARRSGLQRRSLDKLSTRDLVVRRFKRLIIPYVAISSCVFPIKAVLANHARNPVDFSLEGLLRCLAFPTENPIDFFWFLPTLFGITLIGILLSPLVKERFLVPLLALTAMMLILNRQFPSRSGTFLNYLGVLHSLVFFWVGLLHRHFRMQVEPTLARLENLPSILLLFSAPVAVVWLSADWSLRIAASFAGILGCLISARAYLAHDLAFLNLLEGQNFRIYLLSWFPQVACRILLFESGLLGFWPTSACMFISGLAVPILIGKTASRMAPRLTAAVQI